MKIQAGDVTTEQDIAAETAFLNVPWTITDTFEATTEHPAGETVLLSGFQAFPLGTETDAIRDFLTRTLALYKEKQANAAASIAAQDALDAASETASEISGLEITE